MDDEDEEKDIHEKRELDISLGFRQVPNDDLAELDNYDWENERGGDEESPRLAHAFDN